MRLIYLTFISVFSLMGCTATMLQHPNSTPTPSEFAPVNEQKTSGVGVIRYLNEGYSAARKARREDAYKKAFDACDGKYHIIQESTSQTDPFFVTRKNDYLNTSYTSSYSSQYIFIYFECI